MTTLRKAITLEMEEHGETWDDIEKLAMQTDCRDEYWHNDQHGIECDCVRDLDTEYDDGYGKPYSPHFTAWTKNRVYFPWTYDGSEAVASVPRNPCDVLTEHVGGW